MNRMNIGDPAYWDVRYKRDVADWATFELYDWYCPFNDLYPMLKNIYDTAKPHKVLIIGVGRSNIISILYSQGYRDITAIDISSTIIVEMQRKFESYPGVEFFVMDVRQLHKFKDDIFTIIFDKACIDSLFCGTDYKESSYLALSEIYRVLMKEGLFISVTNSPLLARVPYFRKFRWGIEPYKIPSEIGECLTLLVMTKTDNEDVLNKRIPGADIAVRHKEARVVSDFDQKMNKVSTTRSGANAGFITVAGSVDELADLIAESEEVDS